MRVNAIAAGLLLAALAGCETEGLYDDPLEIARLQRLESGLAAWVAAPEERIVLLAVGDGSVAARPLFAPEDGEAIVDLAAGPDAAAAEELFVFTAPIDDREIELVPSVVRIAPGADPERQRYPLGARFGRMAFHPGGRYAVLYHADADADAAGGLYNQNEVAVLDLDAAPGEENPRLLTIGMGGRAVEGVAFPGALLINSVERDLVVFAADGAIVLLDLADPALAPLTVKLKNEDDGRVIVPEQVLARPGGAAFDPMLVLRAPGAQEIFAVALLPAPGGGAGFVAALNQFDSGAYSPTAMALVEDGGHPLLVVAGAYEARVAVIDVETANAFFLELDGYVASLFAHTRADGAPEVVLYGPAPWLYFLAVEDLAEEKGSNLEEIFVEDGVATAWRYGVDSLLAEPYSGWGLTLIDLAAREVTRLTADQGYDWSAAAAYGDVLFYAGAGDDRVIGLDLALGHPEPLVLDEPVLRFAIFPAVRTGLVLHAARSGRATVFSLDDPTRQGATIVDGLWLDGLLDEEVTP